MNKIIKSGNYHFHWAGYLPTSLNKIKKYLCTNPAVLEIGSFEGLGTNIIFELLLKSSEGKIYVCDPFYNLDDMKIISFDSQIKKYTAQEKDIFDIFKKNTNHFSDKLTIYKDIFQNVFFDDNMFDFIYIDGDHTEKSTYEFSKKCMNYIRNNGIILYDDYGNDNYGVKNGVDRFIDENMEHVKVILKGYQIAVIISK